MQTDQAIAWRGSTAVDSDGDKLGTVEEIYLDADTDQPEWLAVKTGLFGSKISFVPIAEATDAGGDVRVPYSKAQVKDAPHADPDGQLSEHEEADLYRHYGLDYGESRSDTGLAEDTTDRTGTTVTDGESTSNGSAGVVGNDVSGPDTDRAMTRSEEEVSVGTAQRETGRVRMKKYIVSENVTQTVPVRREEVRVEREPITDANRMPPPPARTSPRPSTR
jgi:stress response protein YsnF